MGHLQAAPAISPRCAKPRTADTKRALAGDVVVSRVTDPLLATSEEGYAMTGKAKKDDTDRKSAPATEYERTAREADAAAAKRKAAGKIARGHHMPGQETSSKSPASQKARGPKPTVEDEP